MKIPKSLIAFAAIALASAPAGADWKSFLHGDPPPFVKSAPPKQLAEVASLGSPDPQVESFMRMFAAAVMARDGAMILPRLSQRYAVDGTPDEAKASDFMVQAIGKIAGPTRIVIRSVEARGAVRTAKAEFHYGPGNVKVKAFDFDAAGNLLGSDLFSLSRVVR